MAKRTPHLLKAGGTLPEIAKNSVEKELNRNQNQKYKMRLIYIIILCIFLSSCNESNYAFENGDQKLVLKIDNEQKNLQLDKKSTMILTLSNISIDGLTLQGPITAHATKENELEIYIKPTNKNIKKNTAKIKVGFINRNEQKIWHTFSIPVEK